MIEALAERLHDLALDVRGSCDHAMFDIHGDGRPGYEKSCVLDAARLAAAGVTVAPQPAECHKGCDVCRTLNEMDADDAVAYGPAPDALRAAAKALCDLRQDKWTDAHNEALAALRAALGDEP